SSSADGNASSGGTLAIGAAVAITLATVSNVATISGNATANGVAVEASMNGAGEKNSLGAAAIAGGGGGKVGFAGAVAIEIANLTTTASIAPTGVVAAGGGDVSLTGASSTESLVTAKPKHASGGSGSTIGIGASFALAIVNDTTFAGLENGSTLTGAHDLTLSAASVDALTTQATTGAASPKVALAPAVAVSISNVSSAADLGTGGATTVGGKVDATATENASSTTTASGDSTGGSAAVGVALALGISNHSVESVTNRDLTAGTTISFQALGHSATSTSATASASGAPADGSSGAPTGGVDGQVTTERGHADAVAPAGHGSGGAGTPSASTSQGGVSVAAAVGITIANSTSRASIPAGLNIVAGGTLTLSSSADTDASSTADGSASSGGAAAIGAGVAITLANITNLASIDGGAHTISHGVVVTAGMSGPSVGGNSKHELGAQASSGGGGGNVGVAGSLALEIANISTSASLRSDPIRGPPTVDASTGDIALSASSDSVSTVKALPNGIGGGGSSFGLGAAVALSIVNDTTLATVDNGAILPSTHDLVLAANGKHATTTMSQTGASGGGVSIAASVAVAISNVSSAATIGTGALLTLSGKFDANAQLTASAITTASGSAAGGSAAVGVALGLTLATHTVEATTHRDVSAGTTVSFQALGSSTTEANAVASSAGAPDASSSPSPTVDSQVAGERSHADGVAGAGHDSGGAGTTPSASTSQGQVSVAAAVGIDIATSSSRAYVPTGVHVTAAGAATLATTANTDAKSSADGSASTSSSGVAIGAGVAITLANVTNEAVVESGGTLTAASVSASAGMTNVGGDTTHRFGAASTSGAGGGSVGVAGSLSIAIVNVNTTAAIRSGGTIVAGDVTLTATSDSVTTVTALPGGHTGGSDFGLGISVALSIVNDTTFAGLEDGSLLTGGDDLTLHAAGSHAMTTTAQTGAAGGGVTIVPSIAIAISNVTSKADIGTGAIVTLTGNLDAKAELTASATTTADGSANGATAAIGVALALTLATHTVESTTHRDVTAAGFVSFQALGASASESDATASASGAPAQGSAGQDPGGVDGQVAGQRNFADSTAGAGHGSGGAGSTPSASTSDGGVSVAAAVGVNISNSSSRAFVPGGVHVTAGGTLTLKTSVNSDGKAMGDGSASTSSSGIAIGAGVAVNLANVTNEAVVESGAVVASHGLVADASMTTLAGDATDRFGAASTSGAGGGSIGVAGSVSINIVNLDTAAAIRSGATVDVAGGDSSLTAASTSVSTVAAMGGTIGGSSFGLGISFALSIVNDTTFAGIEDTGVLTSGHDLVLGTNDQDAMTTTSQTGAAGPIAIVPSIAISISNVTSQADIGAGALLTLTGKLDATAQMTASVVTTAMGAATGGSTAAIGVSLGLTLATHTVESTTHRDVTAGTTVAFRALGGSASEGNAKASAAGAPQQTGSTPSNGVDQQVSGQRSYADGVAGAGHGSGGAGSTPSASTSSGGVSVAAAVGINISNSSSRAFVPGGIHVTAGGLVTLLSSANTDAKATADGSAATGGSGVSIGAGVAVNLANVTNEAAVETGAVVTSVGLTAGASETNVAGDTTSRFGAEATSGAGGGSIGVAGSVALNFVNVDTTGAIRSGATVDAGGGDVSLSAASSSVSTVKAMGGTIGGSSFGLGISFALSIVNDTTFAGIEDTGVLTNAHDLVLSANGQHAMTTMSQTGAAGPIAVVPSIAVAISNVTSKADIGTGSLLTVSGKVDATARMTASAITSAAGAATGGSTAAVGVSLALTLATHTVESTTLRSITAGTTVSFQALGSSHSEANAAASAAGAPGEDSPDHHSGDTVDSQVAGQRSYADSAAGPGHGSGGAGSTPSASTSSGGVSVAAAVGIVISNSSSRAFIPTGITIVAGGAVTLKSSANSDAGSKGDGSAVLFGGSGVTVGAGVAITLANVTNEAAAEGGSTITSNGFTADASETTVGADTTSTFSAETTAGASGGQVGVAGSVALSFVTVDTFGGIRNGAVVNAGTGDVSLGAASNSSTTTNALMANTGAGGASVGVGVSFALAIVNDTAYAGLENGATLTGGRNLTMRASDTHLMTTQAKMGASSPKVGIAPGIAIVISNVTSKADIGSGGNALSISGNLDAQASMTASAVTSAEGDTHGGTASVGLALALTLATHTVESTTLRNITAGGSVSFAAFGSSHSEANAKASAAGAPGEDSPDHHSGDTVDSQVAG
ncbi:MAG TPA: hypothetical protein VMB53_09700, partial [Gaiellaceae bacterium]|nr:hypothetical protein [Gaiellaceae bacterium]